LNITFRNGIKDFKQNDALIALIHNIEQESEGPLSSDLVNILSGNNQPEYSSSSGKKSKDDSGINILIIYK